jgi:chromosome segregation ATPase
MIKQICILTGLAIFIFCCSLSAEYYQYKDSDGNIRFTDDISQVPESQRENVERHESVKSRPAARPQAPAGNSESAQKPPQTGTWDGDLKLETEQLDQESKELQAAYQELQKQKKALEEKFSDDMDPARQAAYDQEVARLNEKIEQYHEQRRAYMEKMERYEARLRKNESDGQE